MKTIGIVGGLGPQATHLFYGHIIAMCHQKNKNYPPMVINSLVASDFVACMHDKHVAIEYISEEIRKIEHLVDFVVMPCNTVHYIIDELRERAAVPVLAIHEVVANYIQLKGYSVVGLVGTGITLSEDFYGKVLRERNILVKYPCSEYSKLLHDTIFDEMLKGLGDNMNRALVGAINDLSNEGCDAVILACTELTLFVSADDVSCPLISSNYILAEAALAYASDS